MKSIRCLITFILFISLSLAIQAEEQCDSSTASRLNSDSLDLTIKYISVDSKFYDAQFNFLGTLEGQFTWKLTNVNLSSPLDASCVALATLSGNTVNLNKKNGVGSLICDPSMGM